jgi:F-type H+-transporting ATPase subunit b
MFLAETSIQLVPDGTLLLHLLMIGVMVFVLNRTLLKPINKILQEREKNILGNVETAQSILKTSEEKVGQYRTALRDARTEAYHLLEKERAQAVKDKDEKVRAVKDQLSHRVSEELKATHDQELQIQHELEGKAKDLGAKISARFLNR